MKNKATLFAIISLTSGAVIAQTSVLEAAGKQVVKDAATTAAPDVVKGAGAASEAVESAKGLKQGAESAPAAIKEQAQESVKAAGEEKLKQATPKEVKKGAEALKTGKETTDQLKGKVNAAPKSSGEAVKAVEDKAKEKAAEKALDLLK